MHANSQLMMLEEKLKQQQEREAKMKEKLNGAADSVDERD